MKIGVRVVFAFGFAKSTKANIDKAELDGFKALAEELLAYDDEKIEEVLEAGALTEVNCDGNNRKDVPQ